jgi:hypothetical protein
MPAPSNTLETQAAHVLGMTDAEDWADWATRAIVEGFDSPSLRNLVGSTPPYDQLEVERLSHSALAAMGGHTAVGAGCSGRNRGESQKTKA